MNEKQYVIFRLGNEEYSVDIEKVDEISELLKTNKIPNAIYFLERIVNLRGEIIPIINLKKKVNVIEEDIIVGTKIVAGTGKQYITGIGKLENRILILLDLEKILTDEKKDELLEAIS